MRVRTDESPKYGLPSAVRTIEWTSGSLRRKWTTTPILALTCEIWSPHRTFARQWFAQFSRVSGLQAPEMLGPLRGNFRILTGRRVRPRGLAGDQNRMVLTGGSMYSGIENAESHVCH